MNANEAIDYLKSRDGAEPVFVLVGAVVLLGTIALSARFPWGWFAS